MALKKYFKVRNKDKKVELRKKSYKSVILNS